MSDRTERSERTDLAAFLRARRAQLRPSDVGLRDSGRRRTPGLRREEVAALAGVSVDYLMRLEQGRDTNPSTGVLAALADALLLSDRERAHLGKLALRGQASGLCGRGDEPEPVPVLAATVRVVLDHLDPLPAFVVDRRSDVLGGNRSWERLARPLGLLDGEPPNLARFVFAHPAAPTVYPDWDAVADETVAQLRAALLDFRDADRVAALAEELSARPAFAARWEAHIVMGFGRGEHRMTGADGRPWRVAHEILDLTDDGQRLVTWQPVDGATAAAWRAASASTGDGLVHLHAVGDR